MTQHKIDRRPKRFGGPQPVPEAAIPRAPPHLSTKAKRIWKDAWSLYEFSQAESALLEQGLRELDRASQAEDVLRSEGLVVRSPTGNVRAHPCVTIAKESLASFRAVVRDLGLRDVEAT